MKNSYNNETPGATGFMKKIQRAGWLIAGLFALAEIITILTS